MNIQNLLLKSIMIMDLKAQTKAEAIDEMITKMYENDIISDIEKYKEGILDRESQLSTGLGAGIAIPHAKSSAVKKTTVLFAKSKAGIDYDAMDGEPVQIFFMIAAPDGAYDAHLEALAALSRMLINAGFIDKLKLTNTPDDVIALFEEAEKQREKEKSQDPIKSSKFVVAVTACPTGIAHTYMAEDSLKQKAREMGIEIRVETNGTDGVKNRLTTAEIERADGVIIAADKNVEMARFNGKPLLNKPVSAAIRNPQELIEDITSGKAPIYKAKSEDEKSYESNDNLSIGYKIYKNLMGGVSHMLPFVIGGGIVIALAFLVDQFYGVPTDQLSSLGSYSPLAGYLMQIGGAAFGFMLPVLAGYIAFSIADRPGLVAGFVAGAIASAGGAGFLGAILGGFLAGYVVNFLKKILGNLPKSLAGIRAILFYPLFGVLITGGLMLVINIPLGQLNESMNAVLNNLSGTNATLLGAVLGGMMAIDLGGPINKAAYVFGTGTLATTVATGGSSIMAAVMAGGMVPPLAIFIATILFKKKFSEKENQAGVLNLIMGASFITEGAIPFAAADPLRVLPGFIIGSALSGALVNAFDIKLMAPHGGIFVILLISKPILYVLFILLGSLVSSFIINLMKKPAQS